MLAILLIAAVALTWSPCTKGCPRCVAGRQRNWLAHGPREARRTRRGAMALIRVRTLEDVRASAPRESEGALDEDAIRAVLGRGRRASATASGRGHTGLGAHRADGYVNQLRRKLETAIPSLERALDICQAARLSLVFDGTASAHGYAYALVGRLADGMSLLERAVQQPASTGTTHHSLFISRLGEAYSMAGRVEEAAAVAERALTLSREGGEHGNEAWVLRLLGEIAVHRDPLDAEDAERHYRKALGLGSELGMRPLVAHSHFGLGTLYPRTGKEGQAREHVSTAATLYRDMDMGFYLDQAEAALSATMS